VVAFARVDSIFCLLLKLGLRAHHCRRPLWFGRTLGRFISSSGRPYANHSEPVRTRQQQRQQFRAGAVTPSGMRHNDLLSTRLQIAPCLIDVDPGPRVACRRPMVPQHLDEE
jgi:hypothetical protein